MIKVLLATKHWRLFNTRRLQSESFWYLKQNRIRIFFRQVSTLCQLRYSTEKRGQHVVFTVRHKKRLKITVVRRQGTFPFLWSWPQDRFFVSLYEDEQGEMSSFSLRFNFIFRTVFYGTIIFPILT